MKVQNMESSNGNIIPNQFVIEDAIITIDGEDFKGTMFQSYSSNIAFKMSGGYVFIDKNYWDDSRTTRKYRDMFLGESKKETESKIKAGEYLLTDLNQ